MQDDLNFEKIAHRRDDKYATTRLAGNTKARSVPRAHDHGDDGDLSLVRLQLRLQTQRRPVRPIFTISIRGARRLV